MGKTPVIPDQPGLNTNRRREAATSPQQVASPSGSVAHVLLSAPIMAPEDPTAQSGSRDRSELDGSTESGHVNPDSAQDP